MATGALRRCLVLAALGLGVASAACDGGDDAASPTPVATGSPTAAPTPATPASPSPEATSTPSPVTPERGSATLALSGSVGLDAAPSLAEPATYAPPPGELRVSWADGRVLLSLGGTTFVGERATSEDLVLQIVVATGGDDLIFTSSAGECRVRIDRAGASAFAGSFACEALADERGESVVRATGTFRASG